MKTENVHDRQENLEKEQSIRALKDGERGEILSKNKNQSIKKTSKFVFDENGIFQFLFFE